MKAIRQQRLDVLIFANEEIRQCYDLLEDIKESTTCELTKSKIDKFLSYKFEVDQKILGGK